MPDSSIPVNPATGGTLAPIDIRTVATGAGIVDRQVIVIGDPTIGANELLVSGTGTIGVTTTDGAQATIGAQADAVYTTGTGSVVSILKGIFAKVAGTLTATITGALPAGANAIGSVSVSNLPATQPVSSTDGAQVTIGAKADAQATADDVTPFSVVSILKRISAALRGTLTTAVSSTVPAADRQASGTIAANQGTVGVSTQGCSTVSIEITGTWVGTIYFQGSLNGTDHYNISANTLSGEPVGVSTTGNGVFQVPCGGLTSFQLVMTPYTSGSAIVALDAGVGSSLVALSQPLPSGSNLIGSVTALGSVASSSPDSGNPVKVGAKYNATAPTLTDGYRTDVQADQYGNLKVINAGKQAGEDLVNDVMKVREVMSYAHIATAATTVVKSGAGYLQSLTINQTAAGTISIYDNTAGSGTLIAVLKASNAEQTFFYQVAFSTGLTIVTVAAGDVTVAYA